MTKQEHLLTIVVEECNEVGQRATKALRFGLDQVQRAKDDAPEQNPKLLDNRRRIRVEFADLLGVLDLLGIIDLGYIDDAELRRMAYEKQDKVERYLTISQQEGTLTS